MELSKLPQLILALETVKFQLSNWNADIKFNIEVWENELSVTFDKDSSFAFWDLESNGIFGNWEFKQDNFIMILEF